MFHIYTLLMLSPYVLSKSTGGLLSYSICIAIYLLFVDDYSFHHGEGKCLRRSKKLIATATRGRIPKVVFKCCVQ